jgi:hypothetical protein
MKMDRIQAPTPTIECSTPTGFARRTSSPEWQHAVSSAISCLSEGWILPDTKCHPAVEAELAAFLSAYGMLSEEIDVAALAHRGVA